MVMNFNSFGMSGYGMTGYGTGSAQNYRNFCGVTGSNHAALKSKYGVGYEDFESRPTTFSYPMPVIPRVQPEAKKASLWRRITEKWFC